MWMSINDAALVQTEYHYIKKSEPSQDKKNQVDGMEAIYQ